VEAFVRDGRQSCKPTVPKGHGFVHELERHSVSVPTLWHQTRRPSGELRSLPSHDCTLHPHHYTATISVASRFRVSNCI